MPARFIVIAGGARDDLLASFLVGLSWLGDFLVLPCQAIEGVGHPLPVEPKNHRGARETT